MLARFFIDYLPRKYMPYFSAKTWAEIYYFVFLNVSYLLALYFLPSSLGEAMVINAYGNFLIGVVGKIIKIYQIKRINIASGY